FLTLPPPPRPTLFPYTTLFRSIVILLVLAAAGGLIYAAFAVGHVPVKLVLVVALLALTTVWVTVRSAFVRRREVDPGARLELERSEEHTSELQSLTNLVCRLLL